MNKRPVGCLTMILRLFGFDLAAMAPSDSPERLPYRLRDDFLSPVELSFYHVLKQAVGHDCTILAKVNLGDLLFVPGRDSIAFRNKIDRKHVDFLLCDSATMKPRCAVELDDGSHRRVDRQERDALVDDALAAAGLRLVRVPASRGYSIEDLRRRLIKEAPEGATQPGSQPSNSTSGAPLCPKCQTPMVARTAKRGDNAGSRFWGCANYPRCREVLSNVNL